MDSPRPERELPDPDFSEGSSRLDLRRRSHRNRKRRSGWRRFLWGVDAILIGYAALLVLHGTFLLPFVGERNVTTAFLLYLPPAIWLLPLPPLMVVAWLRRKRYLFLLLGAMAWFLTLGLGWQWNPLKGGGDGRRLVLVTYNRGQHSNESFQPFKDAKQPDVIVMQEAAKRAVNYQRAEGYSDYPHIEGLGEFLILSKYPVVESSLIEPAVSLAKNPKPRRKNRPQQVEAIAARHVIDLDGVQVAIYNVHFLTPRDVLYSYRRGGFLWGVLGVPGTPLAAKRRAHESYWHKRIAQARELIERAEADPLPVVLAGDFNAPSGGHIHRLVERAFADSHRKAGRGYGLTFPGTTSNPLSLFGPWLRIDYIFASSDFKFSRSEVEGGRRSQHRAVFAELWLAKTPP